jgi:hypothetical protein
LSSGFEDALLEHGVGRDEIGRGHHVEHLAGRELDDRLVVARHAAHAGGGGMPPLLLEQEGLFDQVERVALPGGVGEAPILGQRIDRGLRIAPGCAAHGIVGKPHQLAPALGGKLELLARRAEHMCPPVGIGLCQRGGRLA